MTATTVHQPRTPAPDLDALRAADVDERIRVIEQFICRELTRVLDVPPAHRIDPRRPMHTQGVGSIMGLQLKRLLELSLGVEVPVVQVLREDSVAELAAGLALRIDGPQGEEPFDAAAPGGPR
ncbi:acyl carrier protein [Streptomyces sparsus]